MTARGALPMLPALMSDAADAPLSWPLIEAARARIAGRVRETPVLTSQRLDELCGAQLYFKCENFQKCGAFKARGATNAVFALGSEQAQRGVATHSSGNHAAALARAARLRGIPAYIVMPSNTPRAKRAAVERYGGTITYCEPTLAAREREANALVAATGAVLVHPYDNVMVMAGQGTVAAELLGQVPELDVILCPVGGGGLISGTAVAAAALRPGVRVFGAEPAGADDAARSLHTGALQPMGAPRTIADGLRGALAPRTFAEIRRGVEDIVTVSEEQIVSGMRELWEVLKIVVEPSGAVPYAALRAGAALRGRRIGVILSGGNLDLDQLPWQGP
ncbi:MAG TPA: pyridoxal-phosphate dependent enzyme, partial [Steroidobacteraceae bacterium]|nr:pyridoxal-phosphate dependent enzyme [Steroidobacteraceae bacterium]